MKKHLIILSLIIQGFVANSQHCIPNKDGETDTYYLHKVNGYNQVASYYTASTPTFTVYFTIPIVCKNQSPIWVSVSCPFLIDYRFVRVANNNIVLAVKLQNLPGDKMINWSVWVFTKEHDFTNVPDNVLFPDTADLPDSVKQWLQPSACIQWTDPFIQNVADSLRDTLITINSLAERINEYCYNIPWIYEHNPISFDAFFAMNWGSSCTGHANAGAALFRANGIPSRVLLNIPDSVGSYMHYIIEYYMPSFGWINMETSAGVNPNHHAHEEIVTYVCTIDDEFPIIRSDNVEAFWFCSDTAFQHNSPDLSEDAIVVCYETDSAFKINQIISLSDSVYKYYTRYKGIALTGLQSNHFDIALNYQNEALNNALSKNVDSTIYNLINALFYYRMIIKPNIDVYSEDFENGLDGWTHGGTFDKWDARIPVIGPSSAYSGISCIGTDLDSVYCNSANNWIVSPPISLNNLSSAYLDFVIWIDVEDSTFRYNPRDKIWVELSTNNGQSFFPVSTCFGGVNDDPEIPSFGGWNHVVLDLCDYIDSTIRIRYHFTSNETITKTGCFIDDVRIYGLGTGTSDINNYHNTVSEISAKCYPVPFSNTLNIEYELSNDSQVRVEVYNVINGKLYEKEMGEISSGLHRIELNTTKYSTGLYYISIRTNNSVEMLKTIKY